MGENFPFGVEMKPLKVKLLILKGSAPIISSRNLCFFSTRAESIISVIR